MRARSTRARALVRAFVPALVLGFGGLVSSASAAAPPPPTVQFHLTDSRLAEISGIAAGRRSPGVVYVQNDSGDSARFFALDRHSGALIATFRVPGATNVDWEDIAVAPDVDGTPSVWLADIGDNASQRSQIELYRVDEPRIDLARRNQNRTSAAPQVWHLRYPDGAHDAESLAVSPAGVPYIFTKSVLGETGVYAAPARPGRLDTLRSVGRIAFDFTQTPGPFPPLGQLTATGADLSRDGTELVVRTYTDAYLWPVPGGDVAAAVRVVAAQHFALPRQPQGEGICFDGSRLLIDSEGAGSAVYSIQPPPSPSSPPPSSPSPSSPSPSSPSPSSSSLASSSLAGSSPAGVVATSSRSAGGWPTAWLVGIGAVVAGGLVVAAIVLGLSLSRRRRPRQDRGA